MTTAAILEEIRSKRDFAAALKTLRDDARIPFRTLARQLERPATTISSWCSGRHLPYQRDTQDVVRLLSLLGVVDTDPWIEALDRARLGEQATISGNPYLGLAAYEQDDAHRYFGRDRLLDRLAEAMAETTAQESPAPIVIIGPSGTGKSSALRAGLQKIVDDQSVSVIHFGNGDYSLEHLRQLQELDEQHAGLIDLSETRRTIVVVDQVESLLSDSDRQLPDAWFTALAELHPQIPVLVGLRGDYFSEACSHDYLLRGLTAHQVVVPQLDSVDISDCVRLPAEAARIEVESALVAKLVADFTAEEGTGGSSALPLLSHVLYELVEQFGSERIIRLDHYENLGGLGEALNQTAEKSYLAMTTDQQAEAKTLFRRLVRLDAESRPICRTLPLHTDSSRQSTDNADETLVDVTDILIDHRLLTATRDGFQIAHEQLLRSWKRLAAWIEHDREQLLAFGRLENAAADWAATGKDDGGLLDGVALSSSLEVERDPVLGPTLTSGQRAFLAASERARHRKERSRLWRRRGWMAAAAVASILALAAGIQSIRAQRSEAEAVAQSIATQADRVHESSPNLAAQLRLRAFEHARTTETESSVIRAATAPIPTRIAGGAGSTALAVSPDGSRVALSDAVSGSIRVFEDDGSQLNVRATLSLDNPEIDVYSMAFSPDGSLLAFGGTDWLTSLWDIDSGGEPVVLDNSLTNYYLAVQSVTFSSDGETVFGAGTSETGIGRWTVGLGPTQTEATVVPHPGITWAIATDADDDLLAAVHDDGTVTLWQQADLESPIWSAAPEALSPSSLAVSPDGRYLVVGYRTGRTYLFDLTDPSDPQPLTLGSANFDGWVMKAQFSPKGDRLIIAGGDGVVRMWETQSWSVISNDLNLPSAITGLAFNESAFYATTADGSLWRFPLDHPHWLGLPRGIGSIATTADGQTLMASSAGGATVARLEEETVSAVRYFSPDEAAWSGAVDLSPDGRYMAYGGRQGEVWIDDLETGTRTPLGPIEGVIQVLHFSPDSTLLAAASFDGQLSMWDVDDFDRPTIIDLDRTVRTFSFPDGRSDTLVVGFDHGDAAVLNLTDIDAPELLDVQQVGDSTTISTYLNVERNLLLVANDDQTLTIWDAEDLENWVLLSTFDGLSARPSSVATNTRGDLAALTTQDGTIHVLDLADPNNPSIRYRIRLDVPLYVVEFTPDDEYLIIGGARGLLRLVDLDSDAARARLCSRIGDPAPGEDFESLIPYAQTADPCGTDS